VSDLSPEQEEVLKAWLYEGPGKVNWLNEYPKHLIVVGELVELGWVEIKPMFFFRQGDSIGPTPFLTERDIPRLTKAGAEVKAQLT